MKSKMYSRPIITSGRGALVTLLPNLRSPIFFKIQISLHTSLAFNSTVISELIELDNSFSLVWETKQLHNFLSGKYKKFACNLLKINLSKFCYISLVSEKFFHLKKGKIKLLLKMYIITASGAGYETDFFGTI